MSRVKVATRPAATVLPGQEFENDANETLTSLAIKVTVEVEICLRTLR